MDTRICRVCGIEKPATVEHFYRSKNSLATTCKSCIKERSRNHYIQNIERHKAVFREYRKSHAEEISAQKRAYRNEHKEQERIRAQNWTKRNPERRREIARDWVKRNPHKSGEWQKKNPEKTKEWARRWKRANPQKVYAITQRRRARKRNLPNAFTASDWQRALDYFGGCCAVCGRPPGLWHTLAMDHWVPLSSLDCPGTIPKNMVPLCQGQNGCNNSKNYHEPNEWLIAKFGKRKANQILKRITAYFEWLKEQGS